MIQGNYEKILHILSKSSGLGIDELEKKVEEKRSKLAGLISREGASQVVAAELGISFENEKIKIEELIPGMKRVNVVGKVIDLSPVRTFMRKGTEGKVVNLTIADDTSNIKVVLWDINHISSIEKGDISNDSVIEISNGYMRDNEIHLGNFSELKLSKEEFDVVKTEKIIKKQNIADFRVFSDVSTRAFILQAFEPRFFYVCPECSKKATSEGDSFSCVDHGKIIPQKRALINLVLDDGTESIRSVLFNEQLKKIGLNNLEDAEELSLKRQNLLGKEMVFSGTIRSNKLFNTPEFIVNEAEEINLENLIKEFEQ